MKSKAQLAEEDAIRQRAVRLAAADGIVLCNPGEKVDLRTAKNVVALYAAISRRMTQLETLENETAQHLRDFNAKAIADEIGVNRSVLAEGVYAAILDNHKPRQEKTVSRESYDTLRRELGALKEWQKGEAMRAFKQAQLIETNRTIEQDNAQKQALINKLYKRIDEYKDALNAVMPAGSPLRNAIEKVAAEEVADSMPEVKERTTEKKIGGTPS